LQGAGESFGGKAAMKTELINRVGLGIVVVVGLFVGIALMSKSRTARGSVTAGLMSQVARDSYTTGFMIGWKVRDLGGTYDVAFRLASGYPTNVAEVQAWFAGKDTSLTFPE